MGHIAIRELYRCYGNTTLEIKCNLRCEGTNITQTGGYRCLSSTLLLVISKMTVFCNGNTKIEN